MSIGFRLTRGKRLMIWRMPKVPQMLVLQFLTAAMPNNSNMGMVSSIVGRCVYPDGKLYQHGYFEDPRNTDDAWMETRVYHFHLPPEFDANAVGKPANDGNTPLFEWVDVEKTRVFSEDFFYGSLSFFVELCVPD